MTPVANLYDGDDAHATAAAAAADGWRRRHRCADETWRRRDSIRLRITMERGGSHVQTADCPLGESRGTGRARGRGEGGIERSTGEQLHSVTWMGVGCSGSRLRCTADRIG